MIQGNPFKAYDIRGRVPEELDEERAYRIGRAYAQLFQPKKVVVGYDVRPSSPMLANALTKGLNEGGCDVIQVGLCGTEQIYFAVFHWNLDGGIMVTASHNPAGYNGMKLVLSGARPVSGDSGLRDIEALVMNRDTVFEHGNVQGKQTHHVNLVTAYVEHLLSYIERSCLKPLNVVVNPGNGCAGPIIDALEPHLPIRFMKVNSEPDGSFPNGIPNPLLPENREVTARAVRESGADVGIAWDGDFDRCFFFDEKGRFIEGYYLVGLFGRVFAQRYGGAKIIHDPRLTWNTQEMVITAGGIPVQSKTGHAFIKERMRLEDAVYGGEMSAHHYFRDFSYCDSGMIPWLILLEIMCRENKSLSALIEDRMDLFPCSGEINRKINEPEAVLMAVASAFSIGGVMDKTDGLSVEHADWRFNLRASNTEPLLRLNVETRGDKALLKTKTAELLTFIESLGS
ncbi:phosphomannomutase [Heliobacillus mobilis]|uniref:Phosphomannomutase n=1 Tax=Heliobacterium mobile TaxID=28064 RepID=A0A6I3SLJ7_HELMO|nr:phosphomannomutase [Heliobacterium mobile]MTV49656.1 phosphomannomutase [Heliobacterium mobile]